MHAEFYSGGMNGSHRETLHREEFNSEHREDLGS